MRYVDVRFHVYGNTYDELDRQARAELARFVDGDIDDGWSYDIDAKALMLNSGAIVGYDAEVTAVKR